MRDGGAAGPGTGGTSSGGDTGTGGDGTSGSGGSSGAPGNGELDPNEIYVAGTLLEGNNSAGAVANVNDPNTAILGFSGRLNGLTVRFLGADLVYQELVTDVVWRLRVDRISSAPYSTATYPRMPEMNDIQMSTAPCTDSGNRLVRFMTGPEEWFVLECLDGYYEADEPLLVGDNRLYALGYDNLALASGGIVDVYSGSVRPHDAEGNFIAARAYEGGFYVALASGGETTLWDITASGRATNQGTYPPLDPADGTYLVDTSALGPDNALYDILTGERVVRRTVEGDYAAVYDEANMPLVQIVPRSTTVVTGP